MQLQIISIVCVACSSWNVNHSHSTNSSDKWYSSFTIQFILLTWVADIGQAPFLAPFPLSVDLAPATCLKVLISERIPGVIVHSMIPPTEHMCIQVHIKTEKTHIEVYLYIYIFIYMYHQIYIYIYIYIVKMQSEGVPLASRNPKPVFHDA